MYSPEGEGGGIIIAFQSVLIGAWAFTIVSNLSGGAEIRIPLVSSGHFDKLFISSQASGIIAMIMIFTSCICCCSFSALCMGSCPKTVRICGCVGFIIVLVVLSFFLGWIALGTYFVIQIHSASTVCRNTIMYLVLLYAYLFVLTIMGIVVLTWRFTNWIKEPRIKTGAATRRTRKGKGGEGDT